MACASPSASSSGVPLIGGRIRNLRDDRPTLTPAMRRSLPGQRQRGAWMTGWPVGATGLDPHDAPAHSLPLRRSVSSENRQGMLDPQPKAEAYDQQDGKAY